MNRSCQGCGSVFQSNDPLQYGYVKEDVLERALYCERCFRLKYHHEMRMDSLSISNESILKQANDYRIPTYYFVDLINLCEESISLFHKIQGEKYLVLTKMDLLPKTISVSMLIERIREVYHIFEEVLVISVKVEKQVRTFLNFIMSHGQQKVLFLGMTNVGKSSLLNELSKIVWDVDSPTLISEMPNTTLNFMEWDMGKFMVVDAPGFCYQKPFESKYLIKGITKKYFKPITMQMKQETFLSFEDLFLLQQDLKANSITFYGSNAFHIQKRYQLDSIFSYERTQNVSERVDLVFPGLGFFAVRHASTISIFSKNELFLETRPSLFGGHHDNN